MFRHRLSPGKFWVAQGDRAGVHQAQAAAEGRLEQLPLKRS